MGRHAATAWRCVLCSTYASEATPRSKRKRALCEDCYENLAPRNLAWCTHGGHRVKATEMRGADCAACRKALNHATYLRYRAQRRAAGRIYSAAHRDELRAKNAAYRTAHPETERAWLAANRPRRAATYRAWAQRNRDHRAAYRKAYRAVNLERARLLDRQKYARKKLRILRGL